MQLHLSLILFSLADLMFARLALLVLSHVLLVLCPVFYFAACCIIKTFPFPREQLRTELKCQFYQAVLAISSYIPTSVSSPRLCFNLRHLNWHKSARNVAFMKRTEGKGKENITKDAVIVTLEDKVLLLNISKRVVSRFVENQSIAKRTGNELKRHLMTPILRTRVGIGAY